MSNVIDYLTQVTLQVASAATPGDACAARAPAVLVFICGAASGGMSPFEYALLGKTPGDTIQLALPRAEIPATLAHLALPLRTALGGLPWPDTLALDIRVTRVEPAAPREIIRAMAQAANQEGCGGDCDCGCSGH